MSSSSSPVVLMVLVSFTQLLSPSSSLCGTLLNLFFSTDRASPFSLLHALFLAQTTSLSLHCASFHCRALTLVVHCV